MEGRGVRLRTQGLAKLFEDMRVIKAPFPVGVKPGLPPWGPHVRFRRVQTLIREGSPLVKLRNSA